MAVNKVNGFRAPYRSQTFQGQANELVSRSGVLSMDGVVSQSGAIITVPPLSFIQNGLLVKKTTPTSVNEPTMEAPYFLTVTSASPANVDNLAWQFAKTPQDVSPNEVIVAEYDGVEWRKLPYVSADGIIKDVADSNKDFDLVGPFSGLLTSDDSPNFRTSPGVLVDKTGLRVRLDEDFVTPIIPEDPDWDRVDRIVYRRPLDDPKRIGRRVHLVGGTYDATTTLYDTQLADGTEVHGKVKVLTAPDNSVYFLYTQGYGNVFDVYLQKYAADRQTLQTAAVVLVSATQDQFDAVVDNNGDLHLAYVVNDDIRYQKFDADGLSLAGPVTIDTQAQPCSNPQIAIDPYETKLFFVYECLLGPSNHQIFFRTTTLTGTTITAPAQITPGVGNLVTPSIFVSDDLFVYITYADALTGTIYYQIRDDIGVAILAQTSVSANVEQIGVGTLNHLAKNPKIFVTDNKKIFITFLQDKGGNTFGLSVWTEGSAFMQELLDPAENFTSYDAVADSFMNEVHLILARSANINYVKLDGQTVALSVAIAATGAAAVATHRDRWGSMVHSWSETNPGTFSNFGAPFSVGHIGPASVVGLMNTINLSSSEMIVPSSITPLVGDRITVSGSSFGNDGAYIIQSVTLDTLDSANDVYVLGFAAPFASSESPAAGVSGQYAEPDGNQTRFIKSVSESPGKAFRTDELDSDNLLARILMPGPAILNYVPSGIPSVNSDLFGIFGANVAIDWEDTASGELTIQNDLKIVDLLNNISYTLQDGSFPMGEGDALYVLLDGVDLTPTPQVAPIDLIPWGLPAYVLGFVKEGEFNPHLLSIGGVGQIESGETIVVGKDLPTPLRNRLGFNGDTTFEPYTSTSVIGTNDSYATAISKLDQSTGTYQHQNRNLKLVRGGTWSWNSGSGELSFSASAFVQVPGLSEDRNEIVIGSSPITLAADGDIAYVDINRATGAPATLTVTVAAIGAVAFHANRIIIARRVGADVIVGNNTMRLVNGESRPLEGGLSDQTKNLIGGTVTPITEATSDPLWVTRGAALRNILSTHRTLDAVASIDAELNKFFGQLKLIPHPTDLHRAVLSGVDKTMLDGSILSQELQSLVLSFEGAIINFDTGVILASDDSTPLGQDFTPFTIPAGEYFWYGVALVPGTIETDNRITAQVLISPASAADTVAANAPLPAIAGTKKIGAIRIWNDTGTITVHTIRQLGVGSGSGGEGGEAAELRVAEGFLAAIFDRFDVGPADSESKVDETNTNAAHSLTNQVYEAKCDKSPTITTTGTAYTLSGTPSFALQEGDIIWSGGVFRRIVTVSTPTTGVLDVAFPSDLAGAAGMVSQAIWTKDLVNLGDAAEKTRPRDAYPARDIPVVQVHYEDSLDIGDTVSDFVDPPRMAFAVAVVGEQADVGLPDSDDFGPVAVRSALPDQISNYETLDHANRERLFVVFFPNPDEASVTDQANLIQHRVSFYEDEPLQNGGVLDSAFCMSDSSGTPINCFNPTVFGGFTRVQLQFPFAPGINASKPDGDLDVYLEGLKIPRFFAGVVGAHWKEVAGSVDTIEFYNDLSALSLSIHVVRRQGVLDRSEDNKLKLMALADAIVGSPAQVTAGLATHDSLQDAHDALAGSGTIVVLPGTHTGNVTWSKSDLHVKGKGRGSLIDGNITFQNGAEGNLFENLKVDGDITFDAGADINQMWKFWLSLGGSLTDNGAGNLIGDYIQET